MSLRIWSAFALLSLAAGACGTATEDSASTTAAGQTSSTTGESTTTEPDMSQQTLIDAAVRELTTHLGVAAEAVTVVSAKAVQWPDGSLGCPEEGMSYTQAIVDGHQVLLNVDDRVYDYHAGSDGVVFLCASEEKDGGRDFVPPPGIDT